MVRTIPPNNRASRQLKLSKSTRILEFAFVAILVRYVLLAIAVAFARPAISLAEAWPQFRGPTGQGISTARGLPIEWSPTRNVAWKQKIPGKGWSSPVVVGGRVYLTTGVASATDKDISLRAICLEADTGRIVWNNEIFQQDGDTAPRIHNKNSHASPTPIVADGRIYVHFGHQGTACLDTKGTVLWRNRAIGYRPVHGNGGSPALVGGVLVFSCDGARDPFVVALDRDTGKVRWKTQRDPVDEIKKFAFCTPLVIEVGGRKQVILPGAHSVSAFDPLGGRQLWRVRYSGYSVIPRPVFGHGLVFFSTSFDAPQVMAVRVDGSGDVTDTHVAWTARRGAPHSASPLLVGEELYLVSDRGVISCVDARSGKVHWQERLGGNYSASPLYAEGRIYTQSEEGQGTVLAAGRKFEKLAVNMLDERTLASYAVVDHALLIRTAEHLYRIENR